jgi:uncharacterized protein
MDFSRTVQIAAPVSDVWALTGDVPTVAGCIPGVREVQMTGPGEFSCLLAQQVGSVKAAFALRARLEIDEAARTVIATVSGQDRRLGSSVQARQTFAVAPAGDGTVVSIQAQVQITGRIATFGNRIIGAKAEQVTIEAVRNVEQLLAPRADPAAPQRAG